MKAEAKGECPITLILTRIEALAIMDSIGNTNPTGRKTLFNGRNLIGDRDVFSDLYSVLVDVL